MGKLKRKNPLHVVLVAIIFRAGGRRRTAATRGISAKFRKLFTCVQYGLGNRAGESATNFEAKVAALKRMVGGRPTIWRYCRHSDLGWTASPIHLDTIFGKDTVAVRTLYLSCRKAGKAPVFTPVREPSEESQIGEFL
jgi:hypothetical protein